MKLIGIYHCPLLGYNGVYPIKTSSYEAAETFMENGLNNFIENVRKLRENENYNNSDDIEYFNYVKSCYWELIQPEDFYLDFYMLDLNNENDWQDIEKE